MNTIETIGLIGGTGAMGRGLAFRWAKAGYRVLIGSRDPDRAGQVAEALRRRVSGARVEGASNPDVALQADAVVLTVTYAGLHETLKSLRDALAGKLVIDTTVPLRPPRAGRVRLPEAGSAAIETQRLLGEGIRVVSALQNVAASLLDYGGPIDCDVLVAGDDADSREAVLDLVRAAGMRGWHAGPLANAAAAEALTSVLIQVNAKHGTPHAGIRITPGEPPVTPGSYAPDRVEMYALKGLPVIGKGDDLAVLILEAAERDNLPLMDDDILVLAQKIVSKAEGRVVRFDDVEVSDEARERGERMGKNPALVQLILDESTEVLRERGELIIVEHRLGFVMANAGVDESNARPGHAILLPTDPDASARALRDAIAARTGRRVGVIVADSIGRAWRNGTVGHALGVAGLKPLLDLRSTPDMIGRPMRVTEVGLADEITAGASALMGQGAEAKPVVLVRGYRNLEDGPVSIRELLRPRDMDLFR